MAMETDRQPDAIHETTHHCATTNTDSVAFFHCALSIKQLSKLPVAMVSV